MSVEVERVGWEDGTLVTPARVNVGGVTYDVTEAEYSGSTPLSAQNLKKMENNTENAINEVAEDVEEVASQLETQDITSLITKTSKVGTIYAMRAYRKGTRCYFSAQFDLLQEGDGLFTLDSTLMPKYYEIGNGVNYQGGSSAPMIIKISANRLAIDSNVYSAIKSYAVIHIEWEV